MSESWRETLVRRNTEYQQLADITLDLRAQLAAAIAERDQARQDNQRLHDAALEMQDRLAVARGALALYADPLLWGHPATSEDGTILACLHLANDNGATARQVLGFTPAYWDSLPLPSIRKRRATATSAKEGE